jgi:RNA polymerase sigma-70 factor (ECF subfamily)
VKDDRALMRRATAGDRDAYARLFERHSARVLRMAYLLLHDLPAAEDAVQETFARGLAGLSAYRGEAKPGVWLYSIGLNVCRETLRKEGAREDLVAPGTLERARKPGKPARGVLTSLMRRETAARLAIALGHLTDLQREVFVLHYVEELPYESVARLLDISVVGARGLAHRAKRTMRSKLAPKAPLHQR